MQNTIRYIFFSVWLRAGSNPPDIDRWRSHTGNHTMPLEIFKNWEGGRAGTVNYNRLYF